MLDSDIPQDIPRFARENQNPHLCKQSVHSASPPRMMAAHLGSGSAIFLLECSFKQCRRGREGHDDADPSGIGACLLLSGTDPASRLPASSDPRHPVYPRPALVCSLRFVPRFPVSVSPSRCSPQQSRRRDTLEKFQFIRKVAMIECTNTYTALRWSIHISQRWKHEGIGCNSRFGLI